MSASTDSLSTACPAAAAATAPTTNSGTAPNWLPHQGLAETGLETVVGDPLRSRRGTQFLGLSAKHERGEATRLARLGLLYGLQNTPLPTPNRTQLKDWLALRHKLLEHRPALHKPLAALELESGHQPSATRAAV